MSHYSEEREKFNEGKPNGFDKNKFLDVLEDVEAMHDYLKEYLDMKQFMVICEALEIAAKGGKK